jgi:hypothetical protein
MTIVPGMDSASFMDDDHIAWSLDQRRIAYLEGELRRIANGNWQSPPIDSASANTYAHIVNEMQNIAKMALTAIVAE